MTFDLQVPILGFDHIKQVELQKIDDIFMKMQAVEDSHISFTLINPFVLIEYDFEVPQKTQDLLEITDISNLLVFNIVLIQTPIEDSMVNFIGPLVFNTDTKKAAQIILQEATKYSVAEKISSFLNK
ncbi:MAG: flagellar assembly protein FliW [Sulfurimonas sp.]|nr:flagellar assembly protein FliW [Sulfurimonas sp.]MBU3938250.1 flagellar assembly protein FliW [bacterium]MBU4024250.1 flagellar assembly protein FliW [bacterium]MBU4058923.1 flagellar assembly protein FliW [bacterium]MBU4111615.1 flagellar assembly protein FliW [bacterium]